MDFRKARTISSRQLKFAPDYALGYVGLGAYYVVASDLVISNQEAMPKAKELLETAPRLDGANADAHLWLATIHYNYDCDWLAAEGEYLRAIELEPGHSLAHAGYGFMRVWQARFDEAERELKLAQELDPLSAWYYVAMGQLLNLRGHYSKGLQQCRKAAEIDPNYWQVYSYCFGFGYEAMGNHGQALKAIEKGVAIESGPVSIAILGYEYGRSGIREQARKVIEQLSRKRMLRRATRHGFIWHSARLIPRLTSRKRRTRNVAGA